MDQTRFDILFVDDEQRVLDALRRQLHSHRAHWTTRYALSGEAALAMLDQQAADVVISDMRMPGMDGGVLLKRVHDQFPQVTRIVLSGQTEQAELLRNMACIHQYLQKPCDPPTLIAAIERAWRLTRTVQVPKLRCAVTKITAMPPRDSIYRQLLDALDDEEETAESIAKVMQQDPALTAKAIQLVSSAFFGIPRRVNSVRDAIVMLGLHTIRTLVTAAHLFDFIREGMSIESINALWIASVRLGERAERLACRAGVSVPAQQRARLAGTMCMLGRAILATTYPEPFQEARTVAVARAMNLMEAEKQRFGATQDDLTAFALGIWGMDEDLVAAAASQSFPSHLPQDVSDHPGVFVHLARRLHTPLCAPLDEQVPADPKWNRDLAWLQDAELGGDLDSLEVA
jgi:HD-like signal output (HDOD) protein/CheY-like chemotaxis protein